MSYNGSFKILGVQQLLNFMSGKKRIHNLPMIAKKLFFLGNEQIETSFN